METTQWMTTNAARGSLRWMAPELIINDEAEPITPATDVYAYGMTALVSSISPLHS